MTPIFITAFFLVSADRRPGNNNKSALIVIPEGFCRGSVVMKQRNDINDRFPTTTLGNDDLKKWDISHAGYTRE